MNNYSKKPREPDPEPVVLSRGAARWISVLAGLAMFCLSVSSGKGAEALKEYELKAAFIYNFTKFVEWPTNSFHDTNAPFVVAVAGNSPCTTELEKIAKERKVNGRDLVIKRVTTAEAARDAHVLLLSSSEDSRLKDWLAAVQGRSVLTIGESELFGKQGGIINFALEGDRIRFDLNIGQADAAGLKVSAQLQKVARAIRKKS